jgi:Zn-dependent peptidase ImmA (M78 family)
VAGKDTNIGAKRARECREALDLDQNAPLACILDTVESGFDLPVVIADMPEHIAGACWRVDDDIVLWVNGTQPAVRRRFTLAHELGHVRCGHDHDLPVETFKTLGGKPTDQREVQANAFAAQLLMPADGIRDQVKREPTLEDVITIASRFGVSTIAALYRLNTLRLVTSERSERIKGEIEDGTADDAWAHVDPPPFEDGMAAIGEQDLPRLSPQLAGSSLEAIVRRSAPLPTIAAAAGCDPSALADGAAAIGI